MPPVSRMDCSTRRRRSRRSSAVAPTTGGIAGCMSASSSEQSAPDVSAGRSLSSTSFWISASLFCANIRDTNDICAIFLKKWQENGGNGSYLTRKRADTSSPEADIPARHSRNWSRTASISAPRLALSRDIDLRRVKKERFQGENISSCRGKTACFLSHPTFSGMSAAEPNRSSSSTASLAPIVVPLSSESDIEVKK